MIVGTVVISLADTGRDRWRHRVAALAETPDGARVILVVDALAVDPEVARLVRDHADRLTVDVHGTQHATRRWVAALRTGDTLPLGFP